MILTQMNKKRVSAKAVQGEKLLNVIFERDPDKGSQFLEISGIQGSGKTSLMFGLTKRIMKDNPMEMVLMREPEGNPFQTSKLGDNWRIFCEHINPIKIFDITNEMVDVTDKIKITYFTGISQLVRYLHPGVINCVYFRDLYKWIDLLNLLKILPGWKTVLWDEYEDICPEHSSGAVWKRNKDLSNNIKQIRKGRITLIANTQSNVDVDFRVRAKITMWCYLFGARLDKRSPIIPQAVRSLSVGSAWIDWGHSFFGEFVFPPYKPRNPIYMVTREDYGNENIEE